MEKPSSSSIILTLCPAVVFAGLLLVLCTACDRQQISVTITSPSDGYTCSFGEQVIFSGNATMESDNKTAQLQYCWTSSRDGSLGSGQQITCDTLSEGSHRITLTVTAVDNSTGTDSISLTVQPRTGLYIRSSDYTGSDFASGIIWTSLTLRRECGEYVAGLEHDDFDVTESIVAKADGTVLAQNTIDMDAFLDDTSSDTGFWEASIGGEPLDIVILSDGTGTMQEYIESVRSELLAMVERMTTNHVDFRIATVQFDGCELYSDERFYGPQEPEMIREAIESIPASHEAWDPTWAYDALLYTPWLGFRNNARRVCIVINDAVPQTAYASNGLSAATRTAAELFLEETGTELYYCQRPCALEDVTNNFYIDDRINPWATDHESGFQALTGTNGQALATELAWPFSAEELEGLLGIDAEQTVTDSRYLLVFTSSFDRWETVEDSALIYNPDDYELRITVVADDPDNPGDQLSDAWSCPIEKEKYDITVQIADEEGRPFGESLWSTFYCKMDGRRVRAAWPTIGPEGLLEQRNMRPGTYTVVITSGGAGKYRYESVRAIHRETITVSEDAVSFAMQVETADRAAELYKARGLLKDIGSWQGLGDPFQDMVDEAEAWLDDIESDGISWSDLAVIKRFMVGLSGYANLIRFSEAEAAGAIEDFDNIVTNFRDIVDEVNKINNDTASAWETALTVLVEIADVLFTHGEFTALKESVKQGLDELSKYITNGLTQELRSKIIEQFPLGDYTELLTTMVNYLIDAPFGGSTSEPDWDAVISAVQEIALGAAMEAVWDEARDRVLDNVVDQAVDITILDDAFTKTVKKLIKDILEAFMSDDAGKGIGNALEEFADGVGEYVATIDNATIVATVDGIFDEARSSMQAAGVPVDVREFLVGMARELTLLAIPSEVNGTVNYDISTDAVVKVLIKYGVYYVILKDYFIDEIQGGLEQTLADAQSFVPLDDWDDWQSDMMLDFRAYHEYVDDVQQGAWDAIRAQDPIEEWVEQMEELSGLLADISEPLDTIANVFADLKPAARNLHRLSVILDNFQILGNGISFGLKVDSLDSFGNQAPVMAGAIFPVN